MDLLATVRAAHLAGVLSVGGALAVRIFVGDFPLRRITIPSLALAVLAGVAWLTLQAGAMAGVSDARGILAALPTVALQTWFGRVFLVRLGCLVLAVLVAGSARSRPRLAVGGGLAVVSVALQAEIGHGAAIGELVLLASLALHLLAAAAWLGGLLPLWLALGHPADAAAVARRFSVLGSLCVAVIVATGFEQATIMIGGLPGLVGTAYGRMALLKVLLLLLLLALAAANRFVLAPALEDTTGGFGRLRLSLAGEIVLGICVVWAAASLGSLPPAVHEQPGWPFPLRPSFAAAADPDLRAEIGWALAVLGTGAAVLLASLLLRRLRIAAALAACAAFWLALPHLTLLTVPAYPTSYYLSLTDFDSSSIERGGRLFARHCAACHGAEGRGDGELAGGLDIRPSDLSAGHLWQHSDGDLFWFLSHGIEAPRGGLSMPGFAGKLTADGRWALIDYLHANNAGLAFSSTGIWPFPVQAPGLDAVCGDGQVVSLEALRGRVVRVVAGAPAPPTDGVATIRLAADAPVGPLDCVASRPEVSRAYAIVAGLRPEALPGSVFVIDAEGWLRARIDTLEGPSQQSAPGMAAIIRDITAHPIAGAPGGGHRH